MRFFFFSMAFLLLAADFAAAQYQKQSPIQHYDYPSAPVAEAPPAQAPAQAPGYYAAPPPSGTFQGGAESVGIGGMALHFPAMTLKLPMLELPSLFNLRSQPKVLMEGGQAPYVQYQQPIGVGAPVAVQAITQPVGQQPAANPDRLDSPVGPSQKDSYQKDAQYDSRQDREIAELKEQLALVVGSLERMARIAESTQSASAHRRVGQTSYVEPSEPKRLPPVPNLLRLPTAAESLEQPRIGTQQYAPSNYPQRPVRMSRLPNPDVSSLR